MNLGLEKFFSSHLEADFDEIKLRAPGATVGPGGTWRALALCVTGAAHAQIAQQRIWNDENHV
jgi:hypothetical protein